MRHGRAVLWALLLAAAGTLYACSQAMVESPPSPEASAPPPMWVVKEKHDLTLPELKSAELWIIEDYACRSETYDEDFEKSKGDSLDSVSDKPFKGLETHETIGKGSRRYNQEELMLTHTGIQVDPTSPPPISDLPRGGELRARQGEKTVPLPLKHTDVRARIAVNLASVTVVQQYHNPYDGKIEAVYVFPLPEDAAIRDFVMTIGDRHIRGIIREREEARRIYNEARRQGYVASLLTQERPNIFTQSVANIEPGKQIDVQITYFHSVRPADGDYEFVFPMVVGPRFNPPGMAAGVGAVPAGETGTSGQKTEVSYLRPEEISSHDISLEVDLDAGMKIENLSSPSHVITVERPDPTRAKIALSPNDRIPNKDFVLRYKLAGKAIKTAVATWRDESGGYFLLLLEPPEQLSDIPASPREMIFVMDCSGSMQGAPLDAAKRALERCLRRLGPNDTFQVIRFSDNASAMGAAPVAATPENVRAGLRYAAGLQSEGGTMMIEGIKAALDAPAAPGRFRIVSFMTDGYIGNDTEILGEVRKRIGTARIFSFGVGTSVNRYLLEGMARLGRGVAAFVNLDESSDRAVDGLYQRIEHPALTDIAVRWDGANAADIFPNPVPDVFVGRPLVLVGRVQGDGRAKVTITGRMAGAPYETSLDVDLGAAEERYAVLAPLWARAKIGQFDATEDEIRRLALQYGLLSSYTAFVAVDSLTRTEGEFGTTVPVPVPVPAGVKYETTVKEGANK